MFMPVFVLFLNQKLNWLSNIKDTVRVFPGAINSTFIFPCWSLPPPTPSIFQAGNFVTISKGSDNPHLENPKKKWKKNKVKIKFFNILGTVV